MSQTLPPQDNWPVCESGELVGFGQRAQALRRRRIFVKTGSAAAAFLVLVAAGGWMAGLWKNPQELFIGGISCGNVQEVMDDYATGKLSEEESQQVREHLSGCSHCRRIFEERKSGTALPANRERPVARRSASDRAEMRSLAARD